MTVTFADEVVNNPKAKTPHAVKVQVVEEKIRNAVTARHARTDEYLKDFDRLRTGYITKAQFDRSLDQHYGIVLDSHEICALMEKYGDDENNAGMVNYRRFCETINSAMSTQVDESVSGEASMFTPLCKASLVKCDDLLEHIAPYYKYHGISIKSCYEDFDQHNIGLVTESQFYRRFPGPPDVTQPEQTLLAKKYLHPKKQGLCNYLDFHNDVVRVIKGEPNNIARSSEGKNGLRPPSVKQKTIEEVFDKIRVAVHKNGIRTTEFFKDHDKLRSGVVTRNQFVCGISLCCGTQANLSCDEIDAVVCYYEEEDGRVRYKEFCHMMENAFNVSDLEKNPTTDVYRPPIGALAKIPNTLTSIDEEKVQHVLFELREIVRKKRLMLYPYFKDFDRGYCYTRGITKTQFCRMLHTVGLNIQQNDLELIYRKFEYPVSGDINYPAFIQTIDEEYCGKAPVTGDWNSTIHQTEEKTDDFTVNVDAVDVDELINRIRHHVLVNRIRVEEFFQDFDPLRHGSISQSRFRMGLSAIGQQHLSDLQIKAIMQRYHDPKINLNILWTSFLTDIEKVFTLRGLEKTPNEVVPASETYLVPKPGAVDWLKESQETRDEFDKVMSKMKKKTSERRILTKPCFQDFDRHNLGYVTKSQLRQCMAYLCLDRNQDEIEVLYRRFSDDSGFNYLAFLEELQPSEKPELKYFMRLDRLKLAKGRPIRKCDEERACLTEAINKIKSKVFREAVRIYEFMKDYDKLRTGRMLKTSFPRALDLCALNLTAEETKAIMDWYTSDDHPDYVDYYSFCDEIETVFTTKGLEKKPTFIPTQFRPSLNNFRIKLSADAEVMVESVMHRLADRVRIRRIQLFPLFKDYDRVHNGTVSRSQLHRVLSELELGSLVSAREFHVMYEKFVSVIGGKHDFNYITFCDTLNDYAQFDPNIP